MTDTTDNDYRLGLTELPAQFLYERQEWLADPDSVQACENEQGGWEVLLRIDGTYPSEDDARAIARCFQQEIHGLAEQMRRYPQGWKGYEPEESCPVCGKESMLCRRLDRYLHLDGSDNGRCWMALLRGITLRGTQ